MQTYSGEKMLIFLDLETTGLEKNDKLCSIGVINADTEEYKYELLNEGKKIPALASSIHHITNEMIKDKPSFIKSKIYEYLVQNNSVKNTLIGHNIKFDIEKLSLSGFIWKGDIIDTLRVTKHLIPECELFSLQVLRYELKLYKNEEDEKLKIGMKNALYAHNALSDALVDRVLFKYLLDIATIDEMKALSFKKVLIQKFNFGKHKGKYIEEVCMNDRGYLEWMLRSATDIDEDIRYSIDYYLQG
jgi:DNA polymerase-3 subunit epsilon/exodeoxyribonuclease X